MRAKGLTPADRIAAAAARPHLDPWPIPAPHTQCDARRVPHRSRPARPESFIAFPEIVKAT
jgi:hypothetical protein